MASCNILEGWKIQGIVVGVYIIVMSADIAYKHANCWRKSSNTVDVSFIYHECSALKNHLGILDDGMMHECNCGGDKLNSWLRWALMGLFNIAYKLFMIN